MTELEVREGPITTLVLRDGRGLNLLDAAGLGALATELARLAARPPRVVVVTGSGRRAFCAGAQLQHILEVSEAELEAYVRLGQEVTTRLADLPVPVIGAINGPALGGGLELALACDLRIAVEEARFGYPAAALGLLPAFGGTQRCPALLGPARARQLMFLGREVDAGTALAWGLVDEVVPSAGLELAVRRMADEVLSRGATAIAQTKRCLRLATDEDLAAERAGFRACLADPDARTRIGAWLASRGSKT